MAMTGGEGEPASCPRVPFGPRVPAKDDDRRLRRDGSRNGDRPFVPNETAMRLQATCGSLKRSLATYIRTSEVVVRGGVEPPTFRFQA